MENELLIEEMREILQRPSMALPAYGKIQNIEDEDEIAFDPFAITKDMQQTLLHYIEQPPVDPNGYTRWLIVNKYRQGGASTTIADAFYCKAQYTPGWEHITTADKRERADYLFTRVNYLDQRWPQELKEQRLTTGQVRSFRWHHNGSMLIQSGGSDGMGVGTSASSWHWSEVPMWPDARRQWSMLLPAIMNRKRAQFIMESTPYELHYPSSTFFMEMCQKARSGSSRFEYAFFPFWDGKLNRRAYRKGDVLSNEEIRLLEKYYKFGLRKEHLMFRRAILDEDPQISKNPELFGVFYPFDDLTCWMMGGGQSIKARHLSRHLDNLVDFPHDHGYIEYSQPRSDGIYVIGADPSGYGVRDHASFHVFEIWAGEWRQVACYSTTCDPPALCDMLFKVGRKYNWAMINVERNGVGNGILGALELMEYPNLYWETKSKPGLHKKSESQLMAPLIEALNETFVLRDRDTVVQLRTYNSDRAVERTPEAEILSVGKAGARRARHHWDKVSALMMVPWPARIVSQRTPPEDRFSAESLVNSSQLTLSDILKMEKRQREYAKARQRAKGRPRAVYRSVRRRRER